MTAAVIFDCDGTLVDSERLARRAWNAVLAGYGITVTDDDYSALLGKTYPYVHEHFSRRGDLPDVDAFWPILSVRLFELIDNELQVFEDAVRLARELQADGVPLAVASGSARERLDRTLRSAEILDLFDVTIAGDEVSNPKPMPDIFLAAADRLGVDPAGCVVVEDSPDGVMAGIAAGMRTIAVVREGQARDGLQHADLVVDLLDRVVVFGE